MQPYQLLEQEFAEFIEREPNQLVACSSGTAALHLALESMLFSSGSAVLVPDFTMIACARAVTLAGLNPVFIDCTSDKLLIDPTQIFQYLASPHPTTVKAIMPVHTYGRRCPMNTISTIAEKYSLAIIEDLAEAHGLMPHEDSDAACWSFYANKIIAGEEGGICYFQDPDIADRARSLRSLGFTEEHNFLHLARGHNYRMANALARLILEGPNGLRAFSANLARRREIESIYDAACPLSYRMPVRAMPWVYDLRIPGLGAIDREPPTVGVLPPLLAALQRSCAPLERIVSRLQSEGIAARCAFKPLSLQPEYLSSLSRFLTYNPLSSNAYTTAREALYLPIRPHPLDPSREIELPCLEHAQEIARRAFEVLGDIVPV